MMSKGFRFILFLPIMLAYAANGFCQTFEISPFSGYTFPSSFDITGGTAKIEGAVNYGIAIGYAPQDRWEWELSYTYVGTRGIVQSPSLPNELVSGVNLHFLMASANQLYRVSDRFTFFPGLKVGTTSMVFLDGGQATRTNFTVGLQAGIRYYVSDKVGFRVQGVVLLPILDEGGNLWWSPGLGVATSSTSYIIPVSLNGGLTFRLN